MNILTPTVRENQVFTAAYGGGIYLFEVEATGEESQKVKTVWNKETPEGYMSSPQWIGQHIYLHGRDQKLHCIDAANGNLVWSSDEKFGQYWSMIRQENRILALDPNHTGALWFTGMALAEAGDAEGARKRWTHLLTRLDPKSQQYTDVKKSLEALDGPRR